MPVSDTRPASGDRQRHHRLATMLDNQYKDSAEYYGSLARRSAAAGNRHGASVAYWISVRAWEKAVDIHPSLVNRLVAARREYGEFIRGNPTYGKVLEWIKKIVSRREGILQSDLTLLSTCYAAEDVKDVLCYAVHQGEVRRTRSGDDARLFPAEGVREKRSLLQSVKGVIGLRSS